MTNISPVYVHGAKHLIDNIRERIVATINKTPHHVFVDPFCGSGTIAALNTVATRFALNFGKDCQCDIEDVVEHVMDESPALSIMVGEADFHPYLWGSEYQEDPRAMLFLDPPRPGSGQYADEFSVWDMQQLFAVAVSWAGPVIICSYEGDMPVMRGGGWETTHLVRPGRITSLSNPGGSAVPIMVTRRSFSELV